MESCVNDSLHPSAPHDLPGFITAPDTDTSSCIVNAYTSNHDLIASKETGTLKGLALHAVDAIGIVHAMLLRIQALLLPIKTLVLSGH
jgi:hypothetical protein